MDYDLRLSVSTDEIRRQNKVISEKGIADIVAEYSEDFFGVLNRTRQFVMLNSGYLGDPDLFETLLGKRPGSVFHCVHAEESEYGCGNTLACGCCGAVETLQESITTKRRVSRDCRIVVEQNTTLNLRVTAVPVDILDEMFVMLFVRDISTELRAELLERTFFHDVLNTSSSLKSIVALSEVRSKIVPEADKSIEMGISDIVDQIQYYRKLRMAEMGEQEFLPEKINLASEIRQIVSAISNTDYGRGRRIDLNLIADDFIILTDRVLCRRIILNLLKNALEAGGPEDLVSVSVEHRSGFCRISVRNPAVMPQDVKLQIFQRSFSTKGPGRGIGTYSIKLLTEQYLKGKVSFISETGEGTIFRIDLPIVE